MRISRNTSFDPNNSMTTRFGDTLIGHPYDEELAGPEGMHYHVWVPEDTTQAQLRELYQQISGQQDIVSLSYDYQPKESSNDTHGEHTEDPGLDNQRHDLGGNHRNDLVGMGMVSNTPGPWSVTPICPFGVEIRADGLWVATAVGHNEGFPQAFVKSDDECIANADLISAAPDLLDACKLMLEVTGGSPFWQGHTHVALKALEAAVKKATGGEV